MCNRAALVGLPRLSLEVKGELGVRLDIENAVTGMDIALRDGRAIALNAGQLKPVSVRVRDNAVNRDYGSILLHKKLSFMVPKVLKKQRDDSITVTRSQQGI